MQPFTTLTGIAAPLPLVNVDTDMIIPKQFLKTIKRSGLGRALFFELRYDADGRENPDFVLNREPWRTAQILIAGDNFGCGSSREHAVWALLDFGIRCVISTRFADIFYNNCFKNGILPIILSEPAVADLMAQVEADKKARVTVDLEKQTVTAPNGAVYRFEIDPFRKRCLLEGLDDIGLTLEKMLAIEAFEARDRLARPWVNP